MTVANNHDLILTGTTSYMNGVLGISKNSVDDSIIIQTDDNLNTKWIVSVDINNTYDLFISSISDENTTYCMST